jgi:hypothetical protein
LGNDEVIQRIEQKGAKPAAGRVRLREELSLWVVVARATTWNRSAVCGWLSNSQRNTFVELESYLAQ